MSIIRSQAKPAFTAGYEHRSDVRVVDDDSELSSTGEIDLVYPNFQFQTAAMNFKLRKSIGQDAVDRRSGKSCE